MNTHHWDSCTSAIPTDHRMVLVRFIPLSAPFIGKGRWSWPISLINNTQLIKEMSNIGKIVQEKITNQCSNRNKRNSPQEHMRQIQNKRTTSSQKESKRTLK
jgi:hypothetical protein